MHTTGIAFDPILRKHDPGPGHPERPARFSAILDEFKYTGLMDSLDHLYSRQASEDDVALGSHTPLHRTGEARGSGRAGRAIHGRYVVSEASLGCALTAAGCALPGRCVLWRRVAKRVAWPRPAPGDEAENSRSMGFCLLITWADRGALMRNWPLRNQACADRRLGRPPRQRHPEEIFYSDLPCCSFSTHQSPWYPGIPERPARPERGMPEGSRSISPSRRFRRRGNCERVP